ncbi:hypothetical protein HanIR_Chr14g0698481 [Helianthus annuus]|nr:hypothetical protein HanIR_Chr14g0698481 [Helianthus annuus]
MGREKTTKASPENFPPLLTSSKSTISSPVKNLKISTSVQLNGRPRRRTTGNAAGGYPPVWSYGL